MSPIGTRGPIPNRSDDLARPRSRKGKDEAPVTKGTMKPVTVPAPDPEWSPISLMFWESLIESGQSDFYQQSDWAFAFSLCDDIHQYKTAGRWNRKTGEFEAYRSPEMLKALLSAMSNLLVTEADRRRVRIELTEPPKDEQAPALAVMDSYRAGLGLDDDEEAGST